MKRAWITSILLVASLSGMVIASQQGVPGGIGAQRQQSDHRAEVAAAIVAKWANHIQEVYQITPESWASQMAPLFERAPIGLLEAARSAKDFDTMNNTLLHGEAALASGPGVSGQPLNAVSEPLLGDAASDLVYVPVPPCRIFDTRLAGGPIAGNSTRGFDVTAIADYSFQGGSVGNCGGVGASGSFAAAVINFTVVTPSGAGYITAFPFGATQPLAATVNYTAGDIRGNAVTVQLDQGASANELSIYTFAQTHVVGDIMGYFINNQATALQCVDTAETITPVAAGATANSLAPACPAGYTQTATNCESSTWQMPFVFFSGGTCSAQNNSAGAATLRSSRTCCRVPGR